eukprot:1468691-Prymnesium_polylepis.1
MEWRSDGVANDFGWELCWPTPQPQSPPAPPDPPNPPSSPPTQPGICRNTCHFPEDGICDDGGSGSSYADCMYGHDCTDCGMRPHHPPAPPEVPPTPPSPPLPSAPPQTPPPYHWPEVTLSPGLCGNPPMTFLLQGVTASGSPYYANTFDSTVYFQLAPGIDMTFTLFYEPDATACGVPDPSMNNKWFISRGVIDATKSSCLHPYVAYSAIMNEGWNAPSGEIAPLGTHSWFTVCFTAGGGAGFETPQLTLEVSSPSAPPLSLSPSPPLPPLLPPDPPSRPLPPSTPPAPPALPPAAPKPAFPPLFYPELSLFARDWFRNDPTVEFAAHNLSGMYFLQDGLVNGAPLYTRDDGTAIYYAQDCSGNAAVAGARWVADHRLPDPSLQSCEHVAYLPITDRELPLGTRRWAVSDGIREPALA